MAVALAGKSATLPFHLIIFFFERVPRVIEEPTDSSREGEILESWPGEPSQRSSLSEMTRKRTEQLP